MIEMVLWFYLVRMGLNLQTVTMGPFVTQAECEKHREGLNDYLTRSHKGAFSVIICHLKKVEVKVEGLN